MSAIAELAEERVVEGVYAVARKRRLRTKGGAPYLALELVDPSGRIEARVWHDVELLDARFAEGDAVRVLGRVEKFRDRLQLDVRTLEAAPEADPAAFAPALRRDADELDGFLEFLAGEISHPGLARDRRPVRRRTRPARGAASASRRRGPPLLCRRPARAHRRRGDDRRETAQLHPRLRSDLLLAAALLHDVGRTRELTRRPDLPADRRGPAARPRPPRAAPGRGAKHRSSPPDARAELLHASPATTTRALRGRPRRRCSTTRTSSTRSRRRDRYPTQ